jgi:hypothetical protein
MRTGAIRFNVRDRGRKHRGAERNFNTAALAALIGSPAVQERVRKRDLHGYFGHWPRKLFGMDPGEGGMYEGKQITLEPALVTVSISANPDGTIEHEAEFLDTAPGRTAKRLWNSKTGGFSSAIRAHPVGGQDQPLSFHGFDYVMEPNFSTNRGWVLDGVQDEADDEAMLDSAAEAQATIRELDAFCTRLQADFDRQAQALVSAHLETQELLAMLAKRPDADALRARREAVLLDHVGTSPRDATTMRRVAIADSSLGRLAQDFMRLDSVAGFVARPETGKASTVVDDVVQTLKRYFGG